MIQEWFYIGARLGFIGFFALLIFLGLVVFVGGVFSLLGMLIKGGDDDGQP